MLWEKLSFLTPFALLTTAYDLPAGAIRTSHRGELDAVVSEIAKVARANGASIDSAQVLSQFDTVPETMQSSMQRDARAGRPLEVDAIGTAIIRRAEAAGLDVPTLRQLVLRVRQPVPRGA
jgi:2-dehydropantoate 2-reductase